MDDEGEMAGLLSSVFLSTFTREQFGELPIVEGIYLRGEQGLLEEIQVGVEEVKKPRGKLMDDRAPGLDNMHPRVLREVAEQIRGMFTDIFSSPLELGQLPED